MRILTSLYFVNGLEMPIRAVHQSPQEDMDLHGHEFSELTIVESGSAAYRAEGGAVPIGPGDVLLTHPGQGHAYEHTASLSIYNLLYDAKRLPMPVIDMAQSRFFNFLLNRARAPLKDPAAPVLHLDGPALAEALAQAGRLAAASDDKQEGAKFVVLAEFMRLLGLLVRAAANAPRGEWRQPPAIAALIARLNAEYLNKISLDEMAATACMSVRTMLRQFADATGDTPGSYLLKLRIAHAAGLLATTGDSVTHVALASGFNDANYFARQFRHLTGTTPVAYRRAQQG